MNHRDLHITPSRRFTVCWLPVLLLAAVSAPAAAIIPTVYTVGSSSDCTHQYLSDALQSAAIDLSSEQIDIHVARATDNSLSYSFAGRNSEFKLANQKPSFISIVGAYASCSASGPMAGQTTTLGYHNAATDRGHSLLTIRNALTNQRATVFMARVKLQGSSAGFGTGPALGGAVNIADNAALELSRSQITGFDAINGGGVYLYTTASDRSKWPSLTLKAASMIDHNTATNGGGISSLRGHVSLDGGSITSNQATKNGGGIYLLGTQDSRDYTVSDNVELSTDNFFHAGNHIDNNTAGNGYSSVSGFGGGIYSKYGYMTFKGHQAAHPDFQTTFIGNKANKGGAIYVDGPAKPAGGPFTLVRMYDVKFAANTSLGRGGAIYSLNAVDWKIDSTGGECTVVFFVSHTSPCSLMMSNRAMGTDGDGSIARGGAMYLTNDRSDGMSRGIVRFQRTWFVGNTDNKGLAAIAATGGARAMIFHRNIFSANSADNGPSLNTPSALIYSHNDVDIDFRYNNGVGGQ